MPILQEASKERLEGKKKAKEKRKTSKEEKKEEKRKKGTMEAMVGARKEGEWEGGPVGLLSGCDFILSFRLVLDMPSSLISQAPSLVSDYGVATRR